MNFNARILVKNHENICHMFVTIEHKSSVASKPKLGYEAQIVLSLICQGNKLVITVVTEPGEKLACILKEHNSHDTSIFESLFAEICLNNVKNVVAGVIYGPPSENNLTFFEKVDELLSKLN